MNIVVLFEGTGQGVEGKFTNVTRLRDLLVEDDAQRLHLEAGPGTHFGAYLFGKLFGADCRGILRSARRWFQQTAAEARASSELRVFLFGFSRGALLARYFAAWLEKIDVTVDYLGVWDTVDSTLKLDVSVDAPGNVRRARHAIARDERRRYFDIVPLHPPTQASAMIRARFEELVFPGVHSDIGGLYADDHRLADETLRWIAEPTRPLGLRLKEGAELPMPSADKPFVLHDSFRLISNLWGLLGSVRRNLAGIKVFQRVQEGGRRI